MEWVVLELSAQGEVEDPSVLKSAIRRVLKGAEVFVPASVSVVGGSKMVHRLIDNYVFVRRDRADPAFYQLEGTKYISSILSSQNGRHRQVLPVRDSDIEKMRKQIQIETDQGIEIGDQVEVLSGAYRGIRGRVIEEIPEEDMVQVYISLRSKEAIVTLPRSFLHFVVEGNDKDATFSPFRAKYFRITEWFRRADTPLSLIGDLPSLIDLRFAVEELKVLEPRVSRFTLLVEQITEGRDAIEGRPLDSEGIVEGVAGVCLLHRTVIAQQAVGSVASWTNLPPDLTMVARELFRMSSVVGPFSLAETRMRAIHFLDDRDVSVESETVSRLGVRAAGCSRILDAYRQLRYQVGQIEMKIKRLEDAKKRHS